MPVMREIGFTALSAAGSIVVLFLLAKLIGARQVSQMTMFDYVVGITIGSVAAELAVEIQHPVGPLTALVVYGVAAVGIAVLTNKSLKACDGRILTVICPSGTVSHHLRMVG